MLEILKAEPKQEEGKVVISFRRKETKKQPVAEGDKYRAVVVPEFSLPSATQEDLSTPEAPALVPAAEVFQQAIKEAFFSAASDILRSYCDSNKDAKEVSEETFTFAAIVAEMEKKQTSQRLNGDMIAAAYDGSKTEQDAIGRYGDDANGKKKCAALRSHYLSLASNNPGISPELATKMIAYVNPEDAGNAVFASLLKKLEVLTKRDTSDDL